MIFIDPSSNLHPFECDYGKCIHCDRRLTDDHDPATCALCDDGMNAEAVSLEDAPARKGTGI